MIKTCFLVLTLATNGYPTLINFNSVLAITENEPGMLLDKGTKIYFKEGSILGNSALSVKETVADILLKANQCIYQRHDNFIYIGK